MYSFFDIFFVITGDKTHDMNYIMKHYNLSDDYMENKVMLGDILNIYLTINGFRDTCLESGIQYMPEEKRKLFEKKFNVSIIPAATTFLITTVKNQKKIIELAKKYQKHLFGKTKKTKEADETNIEMGECLDYITPFEVHDYKKKDTNLGGMHFTITYDNVNVMHDIYANSFYVEELTPRDYKKIFEKYKKMCELLDKISPKFKVIMNISNRH
jgi:hypothetical protein